MGGSDCVCAGMNESSSGVSSPEGGLERLLGSEGIDTEQGREAEVQSDRGGGGKPELASGKEGEAMTVTGTETASVSVREAVEDRSAWVEDEEPEGGGLGFNSVCEVINTLVL